MGWFFKKKKETKEDSLLPDLPEPKNIDLPLKKDLDLNSSNKEIDELPPIPEINKESYQNKIKSVVDVPKMQKSEFEPINTGGAKTEPKIKEIISEKPKIKRFSTTSTKEKKPIYVRLDKFETTIEILDEIKNKITEIETNLKKIREIKSKEEQELEEWEREIQIIKSKIETVDENIFNKFD